MWCGCTGSADDVSDSPDVVDPSPVQQQSRDDDVTQSRDDDVTSTERPVRPLRKSATLGSSRILECAVRYPGGVYVQHIVTWRKVCYVA